MVGNCAKFEKDLMTIQDHVKLYAYKDSCSLETDQQGIRCSL